VRHDEGVVGVVGIVEGCGEVLVEAGVVRADGFYDDTDESVSKYRKRGGREGYSEAAGQAQRVPAVTS